MLGANVYVVRIMEGKVCEGDDDAATTSAADTTAAEHDDSGVGAAVMMTCKRCGGHDHASARSALCPKRKSSGRRAGSGAGGGTAGGGSGGGAKKAPKKTNKAKWAADWHVNSPTTDLKVMHLEDFRSLVSDVRAFEYLDDLVPKIKQVCGHAEVTSERLFQHLFQLPMEFLKVRCQKTLSRRNANTPAIPSWKMWVLFAQHMWDTRTNHSTKHELGQLRDNLALRDPEALACMLTEDEMRKMLGAMGMADPAADAAVGTTYNYALDPGPQHQEFLRVVLQESGNLFLTNSNALLTKDYWHFGSRSKLLFKKTAKRRRSRGAFRQMPAHFRSSSLPWPAAFRRSTSLRPLQQLRSWTR